MCRWFESTDLFLLFLEIDVTSGYITEIFAQRSGDIQIENFMPPSARLLICTLWSPETNKFDTPSLVQARVPIVFESKCAGVILKVIKHEIPVQMQ